MDWPNDFGAPWLVSVLSPECTYGDGFFRMATFGNTGDGAWPTSNLAIFVPIVLQRPCVVQRMFVCNAGTISGNLDLGIYGYDLAKKVSQSAAQSGANAIQYVNCTDTALPPGYYYMGLAVDNTTATFRRFSFAGWQCSQAGGAFQQSTAYPLPSTATPAAATAPAMPIFGAQLLRMF